MQDQLLVLTKCGRKRKLITTCTCRIGDSMMLTLLFMANNDDDAVADAAHAADDDDDVDDDADSCEKR